MQNERSTNNGQALSGLVVLDLSRILAGPWATQNLADLGATVVKIEKPGAGDDTREWGPPFVPRDDGERGDSSYFLCANRGKRSAAIDFSREEGAQLVRLLAQKADVLVENYKVGGLSRYGLGYDDLAKLNPRLIYCSITGYGQTGPYRERPGYDFIAQALGGLMSVTGERNQGVGAPQRAGIAVADLSTGSYATIGILAALQQRHRTGLGQHLDIALLDVQVAMMSNLATQYFATGVAPCGVGNSHHSIVPYQSFPTRDGHVVITVGNDAQFRRFAGALAKEEWAVDSRFKTNADRVKHREILCGRIAEVTSQWNSNELVTALDAQEIPCAPIQNLAQTFEHPQVRARGLRKDFGGDGTAFSVPASPLRLSASPVTYELPPPRLGEHTKHVLTELLDLQKHEVEALQRSGVIGRSGG